MSRRIVWSDLWKNWAFSFIGNYAGNYIVIFNITSIWFNFNGLRTTHPILDSPELSLIGHTNIIIPLGTVLMAAVAYGCGFFSSDPHLTYIHSIATGKVYSNWGVIFLKSIPCNFLVCAAIYVAIAAEDIPGKIIGMYLPISTFAAIGFEHSVANMYFIHAGLFYGADIGYG